MSDTETKFYIILIFKPFALLLLQKTPTVVHSQKDVKQFKQDDFSSWRIIDSKFKFLVFDVLFRYFFDVFPFFSANIFAHINDSVDI